MDQHFVTRSRLASVIVIAAVLVLIAIGLVPPAAIVLSIPFLYQLIRKPVLRRLAVRNLVRRPRETVLIILGALLGTAIITSSYLVGDSLRSSIHRSVYTQLGPVDEVVLANGPQVGAAVQTAIGRSASGVAGTLQLTSATASVSTVGPSPNAEPRAQIIEVDFVAARAFGSSRSATGISGPTPGTGEAVIGADLARILRVAPGQRVTMYAYGVPATLRIVR